MSGQGNEIMCRLCKIDFGKELIDDPMGDFNDFIYVGSIHEYIYLFDELLIR